jgi:hypothetical protein
VLLVRHGADREETTMAEVTEQADEYRSLCARQARDGNYGTRSYWDYLESHAAELAAKFPDRADHFFGRSLGEALAGNDGI